MISDLLRRPAVLAVALGSALGALAAAGEDTEVLARWRGGQLTAETFSRLYDRDGSVRRRGGETLQIRICKAAYTEIYHPRALAAGLDRDDGHLAEVERWRTRRLAARYRQRHLPAPEEITGEAARAEYQRRPEAFTTPGQADLEILFVRCGDDRQACRARMAALRRRASGGAGLAAILAEERERSGDANGVFREVRLDRLREDLRSAVTAAPPGSFTAVVETPIGLYWARVLRREDPVLLPFERVERQIRHRLGRERLERLQAEELARLRRRLGDAAGEDAGEESLLAAAARAEGLDRDPDFEAETRSFERFALADRAFYLDTEILPDDEQLARQLAEPATAARYRRSRWLLAVTRVQGDRDATLESARETAAGLAAAPEPASFLRRLGDGDSRFQVRELGPLTFRELRRRHPALGKVAAELEPGAWRGPFPYREDPDEAGGSGLSGLAFLFLEAVRDPSLAEVRDDLLKDFRGRMAASQELFLATFGRRWEFEVSASPEPAADPEAPDGRPE